MAHRKISRLTKKDWMVKWYVGKMNWRKRHGLLRQAQDRYRTRNVEQINVAVPATAKQIRKPANKFGGVLIDYG